MKTLLLRVSQFIITLINVIINYFISLNRKVKDRIVKYNQFGFKKGIEYTHAIYSCRNIVDPLSTQEHCKFVHWTFLKHSIR